jgi:hypothetical protein
MFHCLKRKLKLLFYVNHVSFTSYDKEILNTSKFARHCLAIQHMYKKQTFVIHVSAAEDTSDTLPHP